jgi:hypothetical protein
MKKAKKNNASKVTAKPRPTGKGGKTFANSKGRPKSSALR